jgi:hypothetical protein
MSAVSDKVNTWFVEHFHGRSSVTTDFFNIAYAAKQDLIKRLEAEVVAAPEVVEVVEIAPEVVVLTKNSKKSA